MCVGMDFLSFYFLVLNFISSYAARNSEFLLGIKDQPLSLYVLSSILHVVPSFMFHIA